MENRIYQAKDKLLKKMEEEMQDEARMDVKAVGELADAVHHLAEAEYYCSVADAMWAEKHGYGSSGMAGGNVTSARRGYTEMPMRSGYTPMRSSMGKGDIIEKLGEEYRNLQPEERMMMKNSVLSVLGSM